VDCYGGGTDVNGGAKNLVTKSWPDRNDLVAIANGHGNLPFTFAQGVLQLLQHDEVTAQTGQAPFLLERAHQPLQIALRRMHVGLPDFHKVKVNDRVQLDIVGFIILAHHLVVNLAAGGHVDPHVTQDFSLAAQAIAVIQPAALQAILLGLPHLRQVTGARNNLLFGETAFHSLHLAAAAPGPATAD
jgi:hypothetical protein